MSRLNVARKFDFSNSFDSNERGIVAARDFTQADIDRAHAEGFQEGHAAGVTEQENTINHAAATALETLVAQFTEMREQLDVLRDETETQALAAVLAISGKLLPHYLKEHGTEEIEGIVRDCLSTVYDEPRVVIRAQESVLEHLKERLDGLVSSSGFGGKVVLFADATLAPHDCRVEWADGGTERDTKRLWQDIENSISRVLGRETESESGSSAASGNTSL
jgi:flagellar assembly protein FliH